jgi:nitronate monooxygenase
MASWVERVGLRFPIVQAPMAGGPDTPALAAAVSQAGGLGSLGCAYLTAEKIEALAAEVRARSDRPFALNLFARADEPDDEAAAARVSPLLDEIRRELGLSAPTARSRPAGGYDAQLAAVLRARPAVLSFTFGMPSREELAAVRGAGIYTVGTATTLTEAEALEQLGVDAICAQGAEAGGHRGTFIGRFEDALVGTTALVRQIVRRVRLPVLAAGGIMDGAGIRAALALGAVGAQLGTAFLDCPEAGTPPAHRRALTSEAGRITSVTRAFSGRPARGIRNRFVELFERVQTAPFPQQQQLTADLRAAAAAAGRVDLMQMWAGQAASLIRPMPAADLVATLAAEAGLAGLP